MILVPLLLCSGLSVTLLCMTGIACAQSPVADLSSKALLASEVSSSSVDELPDAPEEAAVFGRGKDRSGIKIQYQTNMRRFSHVAMSVKFGIEGLGVDLATPLSNKWNLRGGVSFLAGTYTFTTSSSTSSDSFGATLSSDAIDVAFKPHFRSVGVSADYFPWYGSFRISPGLTLYNGNQATVVATVEGGQALDVGDGTYTSDPADPIVATLVTRLGRTFAPRLTMGWGNMIPRAGEHFSFPVEIGVEYVGRPTLLFSLSGSQCDPNQGGCYSLANDPSTASNVLDEQKTLNNDVALLRFYPILSTGVSYRF